MTRERWSGLVVAAAMAATMIGPATPPSAPEGVALPLRPPVTIDGIDSHDGQIFYDAGLYTWVGSIYNTGGCRFVWNNYDAPWCGFGAWTAPALAGPWTFVRKLFDPASMTRTWHNESWQAVCRGDGCFNPRMLHRPDGAWVLWFSAGRNTRVWGGSQWWAMGCNGPTGPCGVDAGPPYGSNIHPAMSVCTTGGDFSMFQEGANAYIACGSTAGYTISIEKLAPWWADGGYGGTKDIAGLSYVEGTGITKIDGKYVVTYGDNCPYCAGTDTSYAVADSILGPWKVPPGGRPRARLSGASCGGQPRSITVGLPEGQYQLIDLWYGGPAQGGAGTYLAPLVPTGQPWLSTPNGTRYTGPLAQFTCKA